MVCFYSFSFSLLLILLTLLFTPIKRHQASVGGGATFAARTPSSTRLTKEQETAGKGMQERRLTERRESGLNIETMSSLGEAVKCVCVGLGKELIDVELKECASSRKKSRGRNGRFKYSRRCEDSTLLWIFPSKPFLPLTIRGNYAEVAQGLKSCLYDRSFCAASWPASGYTLYRQ